ncbi:MAG: hypothetical protein AAGM16_10380 [Pseudomonadota bacterium]
MHYPIVMIRAGLLGATLCIAGCASSIPVIDFYEASSETLQRYQQINVLTTSTAPRAFEPLEDIEGIYCRKKMGQAALADREATLYAIDQVRLKAAEENADAITEPACTINTDNDFSNNCYGSVICRATALRRADR